MPEPDVIPTSASVASTGLGIRYIGNHCYAFSGIVTPVSGTDATVLDFITGSGYIIADLWWSWNYEMMGDATDFGILLKLNDVLVIHVEQSTSGSGGRVRMEVKRQQILLPPFTHFFLTGTTTTGSPGADLAMTLNGRVYGAV